jgi:hypothetical protein
MVRISYRPCPALPQLLNHDTALTHVSQNVNRALKTLIFTVDFLHATPASGKRIAARSLRNIQHVTG